MTKSCIVIRLCLEWVNQKINNYYKMEENKRNIYSLRIMINNDHIHQSTSNLFAVAITHLRFGDLSKKQSIISKLSLNAIL